MMGNYACAMAITMQKCSRAAVYRFSGLSNSSGEMFSKLLWLPFPSNSDRVLPFFFFFFSLKLIYLARKMLPLVQEEPLLQAKKDGRRQKGAPVHLPKFGSEPLAVQQSGFMKHRRPVKAYYLIIILLSLPMTSSPHITGDERRRKIPEPAAQPPPPHGISLFSISFFNYRPMNFSSRVFFVSCNSGIKQQVFVLLFDL